MDITVVLLQDHTAVIYDHSLFRKMSLINLGNVEYK